MCPGFDVDPDADNPEVFDLLETGLISTQLALNYRSPRILWLTTDATETNKCYQTHSVRILYCFVY